jgi:hypothetical protein
MTDLIDESCCFISGAATAFAPAPWVRRLAGIIPA